MTNKDMKKKCNIIDSKNPTPKICESPPTALT